jgi:hypothetical protein
MDVLEWRGDSDDTTSGPACVNAGAHGDERRVRSTGASSRHGHGRFFTARLTVVLFKFFAQPLGRQSGLGL